MKIKKLFFGLAVLIILISNISALGVTPGRTTIDFVPGLEKTIEFSIINPESENMNLIIVPQGELKDYISVEKSSMEFGSSDSSKQIIYSVKLPQSLSPGLHKAEIVVAQMPDKFSQAGETSVGAILAVATQLYVNAPYPGKYAEASLNIFPEKDGTAFIIPVLSKGEFGIAKVKAEIDIYNFLNEKIVTIYTDEISIPGKSRGELRAVAKALNSGQYRAVATLIYDENSITLEKEFSVGKKNLDLISVDVNDFSLGSIAKFEMLVENKWSDAITGVYTEMVIYGADGNILATFKSPASDIAPFSKSLLVSYWDTKGVKKSTYLSSLFLKYGENSEKRDLSLEVMNNKINVIGLGYVISESKSQEGLFVNNLLVILVILIVILLVLNIAWFLFIRRRLRK